MKKQPVTFFLAQQVWLLAFLIISCSGLTCSLYDFSRDRVVCTNQCPADTTQIGTKCLRSNQYLIGEVVSTCLGTVSQDFTMCCPAGHYIFNRLCLWCSGSLHNNGAVCCPSDTYAQMSTGTVNCLPIKTGPCANTINQLTLIKVCCGDSLYYNIRADQCVTYSSSLNCDLSSKICCNLGERLDYFRGYSCVSQCNWINKDSFYCAKRTCSAYNQILVAGPQSRGNERNLALGNNCCYSRKPDQTCLVIADRCENRFSSKGWSVCCPRNAYYSFTLKQCRSTCSDVLLFDMLCISASQSLSFLEGAQAGPQLVPVYRLCLGRILPDDMPVCCPASFYVNWRQGCERCNGRIFRSNLRQLCCKLTEYYDEQADICKPCSGKVDSSGKVCCPWSSYISYLFDGSVRCSTSCALQNIYKTNTCCESSSCASATYYPSVCSKSYSVVNACNGCPNFCSQDSKLCVTSAETANACSPSCTDGSALDPVSKKCIACPFLCRLCQVVSGVPVCSACNQGFYLKGSQCTACSVLCLTCSVSATQCTSCSPQSQRSSLVGATCVRICASGYYYFAADNLCRQCDTSCLECTGPLNTDCTKCVQTKFVVQPKGACQGCDSSCLSCVASSRKCVSCQQAAPNYDPQAFTCISNCIAPKVTIYFSSIHSSVCRSCNPKCLTCVLHPQNCQTCPSNTFQLQTKFGLQMCLPCIEPCLTCSSSRVCLSCLDGFYLDSLTSSCKPCNQQCRRCDGALSSSCLDCYGLAVLFRGSCNLCSSVCEVCESDQLCSKCITSYLLFAGSCVTICPTGYYNSGPNCLACPVNCIECTSDILCQTCRDSAPLLFQGGCLQVCPSNYSREGLRCIINPQTSAAVVNPNPSASTTPSNPIPTKSSQSTVATPTITVTVSIAQVYDGTPPVLSKYFTFTRGGLLYLLLQFQTSIAAYEFNPSLVKVTGISRLMQQTNNVLSLEKFNFFLFNPQNFSRVSIEATLVEVNKNSNKIIYLLNLSNPIPTGFQYMLLVLGKTSRDTTPTTLATPLQSSNTNPITPFKLAAIASSSSVSILEYSWPLVGAPLTYQSYSSQSTSSFRYFGLVVGILFLPLVLLTKWKTHFEAEQSNTICLHVWGYFQLVYFFKFITVQSEIVDAFLEGFGYWNFTFFPNVFQKLLPSDYVQLAVQRSLSTSGALVSNCGSVFFYQLIVAGSLLSVAAVIRALLLESITTQVRDKVLRLGLFLFSIGYLQETFYSYAQLLQPAIYQDEYASINSAHKVAAGFVIVLVPIVMIATVTHFYLSYKKDVLEHYSTLREASQFLLIYFQAIIMVCSIGRRDITLFLVGMELVWLCLALRLYRYATGEDLMGLIKFFVMTGSIIISYLFLGVGSQLSVGLIVFFVIVSMLVNTVYCYYQVVCLYYFDFFGQEQPQSTKGTNYT